jgi:hypothetical protein
MGAVSLTGKDTIQIDNRILNDLADGDAVLLSYPNDIANVKASKNGNMIYALNNTGMQCEVTIRVLAGSADDKYLNSRLAEMKLDFSKFVLMTGVFSKRVGDGAAVISSVVYQCSGGVVRRQPEAKTNAEGDTTQSVVVYMIAFGNGDRSIQ